MKNIYLAFLFLLMFASCNNVNDKTGISESINYQVDEINSSNVAETNYLELLKNYLEISNKKNTEVNKIFLDEDGNLRIDNKDGNFLSVYGLSNAKVYKVGSKTDRDLKVVIEIMNEGGGGGGNVQIVENYLIENDEVTKISNKIIDAPKSEFGYEFFIKGIIDEFVIIDFQKRNDTDFRTILGNMMELKCELIDNSLKVVEVLQSTKQFTLFCDETYAWMYSVSMDNSKITFKLYPGEQNDYYPNKDEIIETVEGTVKNNIITIPVPKDCEDCGYGYATGRFKFSNGVL